MVKFSMEERKQVVKKILVVAAHPDDETLGCGGTIARLAREGHSVTIAIFGEGITSRYMKRDQVDPSLVQTLQARSRKVSEILGAKEMIFHNLPDNRFDTIPLLEIVKMLEQVLVKVSPQIIFTHHGGDLNIDHKVIYRATLTATRPIETIGVQTIYAYEVPSSTEWAFQKFEPIFKPNVFMNISKTLELKLKAMETYESELLQFPHPRSLDALKCIAHRWGSVSGLKAAEAFELVRAIR